LNENFCWRLNYVEFPWWLDDRTITPCQSLKHSFKDIIVHKNSPGKDRFAFIEEKNQINDF